MPPVAETGLLLGVGMVTGFINILAGGGSLLTLPTLIFLGLPGPLANGTNRVAILIQNLVAVAGFHRQDVFPLRTGVLAAVPALAGALIGAQLAVDIPDRLFRPILAVVMIAVTIFIVVDPPRRFKGWGRGSRRRRRVMLAVGFFFVGIYGGFIQAGVGFFIITLMLAAGYDLIETNAVKILVIGFFTLLALGIFLWNGQVNLAYGIVLGFGNAIGGWIATHVAVRKGHKWIRRFVVTMVLIFAAKLLFDAIV